jgi:hypothetical protein
MANVIPFNPLLYAPAEYWKLTVEQKREICNGCGTKGLIGYIVPDSFWGLCIKAACDIHDYMYHIGETHADKEAADRVFKYNMLRLIDAVPVSDVWLIRQFQLRLKRRRADLAEIYYNVVDKYGGPAFWTGKNDDAEMGMVPELAFA